MLFLLDILKCCFKIKLAYMKYILAAMQAVLIFFLIKLFPFSSTQSRTFEPSSARDLAESIFFKNSLICRKRKGEKGGGKL